MREQKALARCALLNRKLVKLEIMKIAFLALMLTLALNTLGQQVDIPKGIVYKYCDSTINEKAKLLVEKELSSSRNYSLNGGIVFIGPVLWSRYKNETTLNGIKGGDMTVLGYDKKKPSGKITQNKEDFKLVWDHLQEEVSKGDFKLRKATPSELKYYWGSNFLRHRRAFINTRNS
jgi:hypothetical protein